MSLVLVLILIFCLCYFIQAKYKLFLVGSKIAGHWFIPLVGNVQMMKNLKPQFIFLNITESRRIFGETFRLWLGTQLWVFLHSPAEARDALNDVSLVRPDTFHQLQLFIGNGLLISEGTFWEAHRRILGPAFHPSILNSFTNTIIEHADVLVDKISAHIAVNSLPIEVSALIFPCILDTILDTSMGKNLNLQRQADEIYTNAFQTTSKLLFKRMVNPLLAPDFIFKRTNLYRKLNVSINIIHKFMEQIITERADYLKTQSINAKLEKDVKTSKQRIFLDALLSAKINGQSLSSTEVRDEVITFVFAGVDTTAAAMGFILYALAKYPTAQDKLYAEIKNLPCPKSLNVNDLHSMLYLDMFIKECLRFYTIVPMTARKTTRDTKIGHTKYCADIQIWINIYGLAHDAEYFEQPYEFRPERFSPNSLKQIPAFSYIPFSGGSRICIGRKYAILILKIVTIRILQNFKLQLYHKNEELILMVEMVLKSLHGLNILFERR